MKRVIPQPDGFVPWIKKEEPKYVEIDGEKCKGFVIVHRNERTFFNIQISIKGKMHRFQSKDLSIATKRYMEWKEMSKEKDPVDSSFAM